MNASPLPARTRNAEATRNAILVAARDRFAHNSYDNVGIREIAAQAGIDSALISRYFGGKEDLFSRVLDTCKKSDLLDGGRDGLSRRVAEHLVDEHGADKPLDDLLILLNSAGSPTAGRLVRKLISETYNEPLARMLGGANPLFRARLFGAALMGLVISARIHGPEFFNALPREAMIARISELIDAAICDS